jgi:hypothetical protein
VRQAARDWLAEPAHIAYWEDFLGLTDGALARMARHVLGEEHVKDNHNFVDGTQNVAPPQKHQGPCLRVRS